MSNVRILFKDQTQGTSDSEDTVIIKRFEVLDSQNSEDELLSVSQFAELAAVSPQAVRKMIIEGRLKARKVGEQHVITQRELTNYLTQR